MEIKNQWLPAFQDPGPVAISNMVTFTSKRTDIFKGPRAWTRGSFIPVDRRWLRVISNEERTAKQQDGKHGGFHGLAGGAKASNDKPVMVAAIFSTDGFAMNDAEANSI